MDARLTDQERKDSSAQACTKISDIVFISPDRDVDGSAKIINELRDIIFALTVEPTYRFDYDNDYIYAILKDDNLIYIAE